MSARAVRSCVGAMSALGVAVLAVAVAGVTSLAAQVDDVRPLPTRAVAEPRVASRVAVYGAGSVGRLPARAFGSIVDRSLSSLVVEWQQPFLGGERRGVAWAPALHPALSMSRVPTTDALIYYDCASALAPQPDREVGCTAKWSDAAQARALALEPLAFRLWQRVGPVELSLRPGIGVTHFARAVPIPEGRRVNALLRLDGGAAVPISTRDRLHLQFGWWHVSNAGRGALNPGVDALQLQLGLSHAWGR